MRPVMTYIVITLLWIPTALAGLPATEVADPTPEAFRAYWYPNGAELSRFDLRQARYGEYHAGDAVMVFVTEALNPHTQIKADRPGPQDIPILKLNAVRKFYTGIYPYSTMTSVFSPVEAPAASLLPLKITTSVQEWCGHVFIQLNREKTGWRYASRSYFESDGDRDDRFGPVLPEDALWNLIRIAPAQLPQGPVTILPGTLFTRLTHRHPQPQQAQARLQPVSRQGAKGQALLQYALDMPDVQRRLVVWFERHFPHRIEGWEEHGRTPAGKVMVTRARRTHLIMLDYWNHHANRDRALLTHLGLAQEGG
ncbi:MAG: hypothetical protein QNJ02_01315 [Desulfobacterales bacterium]|nr:hypothetical protein [Desulfobacterales bacterium]